MAGAPYYLAYTARPTPASSGGGGYGLFVVPSNALASTPLTVTNAPATVLGVAEQPTFDGSGNLTGRIPYGLIYATTNPGGNNHFYALPLDATKAPAPAQLSSAGFPGFCGNFDFLTDKKQASSEVLLYALPGSDGVCGTADDLGFLIHYGDSATTTPTSTALSALAVENFNLFEVRNGDGTLAGLGSIDPSNNLVFSSDLSYAKPSVLLSQVSALQPDYNAPGFCFITVTLQSGRSALYRVDNSGKLSNLLYQVQGNPQYDSGAADGAYFYFTDTAKVGTSTSYSYSLNVVKVPLDGSAAAQVIASTSGDSGSSSGPFDSIAAFIGSTAFVAFDTGANTGNSFLDALDTATAGAPLKRVLTAQNGSLGFSTTAADNRIFVAYTSAPAAGQVDSYTTAVLDAAGNVVKQFANTDLRGANYVLSGPSSSLFDIQSTVTAVYLAQGVSAAGPFDAGATLAKLDPSALITTPVTDGATGKPYVLDNGQFSIGGLFAVGMPANGSTDFVSVTNTGQQSDAVGFDAVNNVLYRFTNTANTNETAVNY